MSDERDERVTAAYRDLGAEEPPRALDAAILAAARRPASKPWTRRYAVPLSLAAVLVLSITVTLRIQHEAPELEKPVVVREQAVAQAPAAEQAPLKLKAEVAMKSAPAPRAEPKPFADAPRRAPEAVASAAPAPAPASAPAPSVVGRLEDNAARADAGRGSEAGGAAAMRQAEERVSRDAEAASRAASGGPVQALAKRSREVQEKQADVAAAAPPRPEAELERIAQLRAAGRHDEADKALAEFRKRLPDYRISEEMLKKVERR